jgi:hypothetical protein
MTQLSTSEIPGGFTENTAQVNGVTLNYAIGGTGPAVGAPARLPADLVHVAEGNASPRRPVHRDRARPARLGRARNGL